MTGWTVRTPAPRGATRTPRHGAPVRGLPDPIEQAAAIRTHWAEDRLARMDPETRGRSDA